MSRSLQAAKSALAFAAVIGATTVAKADGECNAPNVMIVLDKSSSMVTGNTPSGITKWAAAEAAVGEIVSGFGDRINFGLVVFPAPNMCAPGRVVVSPGPDTADAIIESLGDAPPSGGNYTPLAETFEALLAEDSLLDLTRETHVILISDGWQYCVPYDAGTAYNAVPIVEELAGLGITTHAIGLGYSVNPILLDRVAVAGGTAIEGCTVARSTTDYGNCYEQVEDLSDLRGALEDIATDIGVEVCDGVDNDCDGEVDEGFDRDFDGVAECAGDCNDNSSDVYPGAADGPTENCDTLDNDCDGVADEGCSCTSGVSRDCDSGLGVCGGGRQTCEAGSWGDCVAGGTASAEICDGLDNDCDGTADDNATCPSPTAICVEGRCEEQGDPDTDMDTVPDRIEQPRGDTDGDGMPDWMDPDDDNDTIPTRDERPELQDIDTDEDERPNYLDPDDDNDTIPTRDERPGMMDRDTDDDGRPNHLDPDDDDDTIPTATEVNADEGSDFDGDDTPNHWDLDSDDDGFPDIDEGTYDDDNDGHPNYLDVPEADNSGVAGGAGCAVGGSASHSSLAIFGLLLGLMFGRTRARSVLARRTR